jgi:hypothetical protein
MLRPSRTDGADSILSIPRLNLPGHYDSTRELKCIPSNGQRIPWDGSSGQPCRREGPASMRFSSEFVSNEINENESQFEKHSEQRI